jgi:hypothetical protein
MADSRDYSDLFSKRYGLRPTPEGLMYQEVPERARIGLYHIVEKFFGEVRQRQKSYSELYKEICIALRIQRDRRTDRFSDFDVSRFIETMIMGSEWHQFYDICQVLWDNFGYDKNKHQEEISKQINLLFREERLGFELRDGKVEKVGSGYIDAQIKETRYLLKEPEFKSADELFEKAIRDLNIRPEPDVENCIKDAVAAIESVSKIIIGDKDAKLETIIKSGVQKGAIPQLLDQTILKLHAYRGNEPAVAHGGIQPSKVTTDEAEFVLAMSAAIIDYLVKKRKLL